MEDVKTIELCQNLDMLGPCADIEKFMELLEKADSFLIRTPEIMYFISFVIARNYFESGVFRIPCDGISTGEDPVDLLEVPLDQLSERLDRDLDSAGWSVDYNFIKGIYDARFLHERLGFLNR